MWYYLSWLEDLASNLVYRSFSNQLAPDDLREKRVFIWAPGSGWYCSQETNWIQNSSSKFIEKLMRIMRQRLITILSYFWLNIPCLFCKWKLVYFDRIWCCMYVCLCFHQFTWWAYKVLNYREVRYIYTICGQNLMS